MEGGERYGNPEAYESGFCSAGHRRGMGKACQGPTCQWQWLYREQDRAASGGKYPPKYQGLQLNTPFQTEGVPPLCLESLQVPLRASSHADSKVPGKARGISTH